MNFRDFTLLFAVCLVWGLNIVVTRWAVADAGIPPKMTDGTGAKTAGLEPPGCDPKSGQDLYPQMLRNLATSLAGCLARS